MVSAQNEETTSNKNDRRSEDQIEFARGKCKMHAVQERPSFYGYYFDNFMFGDCKDFIGRQVYSYQFDVTLSRH